MEIVEKVSRIVSTNSSWKKTFSTSMGVMPPAKNLKNDSETSRNQASPFSIWTPQKNQVAGFPRCFPNECFHNDTIFHTGETSHR